METQGSEPGRQRGPWQGWLRDPLQRLPWVPGPVWGCHGPRQLTGAWGPPEWRRACLLWVGKTPSLNEFRWYSAASSA